jgi:hypothetical protein
MKHYRLSPQEWKIVRWLEKMKEEGSIVTIWQREDDQRKISSFHIKSIQGHEKKISYEPISKDHMTLNIAMPAYITLDHGSMVFKADLCEIYQSQVISLFPEEIHLKDLRDCERRPIKNHHRNIIQGMIFFPLDIKPLDIKLPVFDISESGISLIINKKEANKIKADLKIFIHKIGLHTLKNSITGKIIYLAPYVENNKVNDDLFRIGVKFDKKISTSIFQMFEK